MLAERTSCWCPMQGINVLACLPAAADWPRDHHHPQSSLGASLKRVQHCPGRMAATCCHCCRALAGLGDGGSNYLQAPCS